MNQNTKRRLIVQIISPHVNLLGAAGRQEKLASAELQLAVFLIFTLTICSVPCLASAELQLAKQLGQGSPQAPRFQRMSCKCILWVCIPDGYCRCERGVPLGA